MIPKSEIEAYLQRPLDNHLWVRKLKRAELLEAVASLRPVPRLYPKLRKHQLACFLLGVAFPQFCFFLDMGCVDGETEYLSPTGWRKIKEYSGEKVMQYTPQTGVGRYVKPTRYISAPCDRMVRFKTARGLDQMLSPEHTMLVSGGEARKRPHTGSSWKHTPVAEVPYQGEHLGRRYWFYKASAEEMLNVSGQRHASIETTFRSDASGVALTDAQIRVQVAVHADGYLRNKTKVGVNLKKLRKKERLRTLLAAAGIDYRERDAGKGYSVFVFTPPVHTKVYGPEWFNCSLRQKEIICDEAPYWDGTRGKSGGVSFYSRSASCAEFIQFCYASTGRRAYLRGQACKDDPSKIDWVVHAVGSGRTKNFVNLLGGEWAVPADGRKYCFEVPSGYLVLRRNGNIFTTGNSGKSLLALELLKYWIQAGVVKRALIFLTSDKAFDTWESQFEKFNIDVPVLALEGPSKKKWQQLEEFSTGIVLVPYPGAVAMACSKKKGSKGLHLDQKKINKLATWADALVLDESTRAGNKRSLTFRLLRKLAKRATVRYALAGRPFGRDPTMLWSQYFIIDGGETLGETLGLYRAAFFSESENRWDPKGFAKTYKFREEMRPKLSRIIQNRSIVYTADECTDLPKVVPVEEFVHLPEEAEAYYKRVVEEIKEARGDLRATRNVFLRMRQISSGFLGFVNDTSGEKAQIEFDENPKLERLLDLVDELPEGHKAVIFYEYTFSGQRIVSALKKEFGLKPIWLWSGTKTPTAEIKRFKNDSGCTVAVVNNRVGAMSLDGLQYVANYTMFYESPVSSIDREQAERRLVRDGQPHPVFQYDLLVKGTADEKIREFHYEGADLISAVLKDPIKALGL